MEIYMIRHGMTAGNLEKRYIGRTDESLLTASKITLQNKNFPFPDLLVVSPLLRCRQTAEILFPGKEYLVEYGLRETDFGSFEGKNYKDLSGDKDYQAWIDSGGVLPFPGGESMEETKKRCCEAFLRICRQYSDKERLTFVVHGGSIMSIFDAFSEPHFDFYHWQVSNGEGYLCEFSPYETLINIRKID